MKSILKKLTTTLGYRIEKIPEMPSHGHYDRDGLRSIHSHRFMDDPRFQKAFDRGTAALDEGETYGIHWRLHIALWVARNAIDRGGHFVECGVNKGFVSSAVMDYLDWNDLDRSIYLLDTFQGIAAEHLTEKEAAEGAADGSARRLESGFYVTGTERVRKNFSEWDRVKIIEGTVPETLAEIDTDQIGYLHLDMNCSAPEVAAMEELWDRIVPGGMILMDDYCYWGYDEIHDGANRFARARNVEIVALPTGQGILIKP